MSIKVQAAFFSLVLLGPYSQAFNTLRPFSSLSMGGKEGGISPPNPMKMTTTTTNTSTKSSFSTWKPNSRGGRLFSSTSSEAPTTTVDEGESDGGGKTQEFSKLRVLKDRMWVREALEDLTAADFACSVAQGTGDGDGEGKNSEKPKSKNNRAVDFDNILSKLEKRIEDMCVRTTYGDGMEDDNCIVSYPLDKSISSDVIGGGEPNKEDECWSLKKKFGMASVTYTDEQRSALVMRLLSSRENLIKAMSGQADSKEDDDGLDEIREKLQTPDAIDEKDKDTTTSSSSSGKAAGDPLLYVRDDGTIDWDGALQDSAALKKFGISVWARINGQDEDSVDADAAGDDHASHAEKKVTAKIADTDAIRDKKEKLDSLKAELKDMDSEHTALLNSAVSAGSAVAAVNLAMLEPELRSKIRASYEALEKKKDEVIYHTISYEMERIYTYLDGELGNTSTKGYIPLQDRLNVAEFGLLESQFNSLEKQIVDGDTIDSDVLAVLSDQTVDFKRRLGIDYYVTGLTLDQENIKTWSNDLLEQSKKGLAFYGKGVQLLWNDCLFSISLIGRALGGYTLKPREVRTVRRTFKDILTFIPFVIILIIPLSPIGHVLVFGAIQRFFPDFFPSCFTERRQNLLNLYESTEFSQVSIKENVQEKFIRVLEAAGFYLVDNTKKALKQVSGKDEEKEKE